MRRVGSISILLILLIKPIVATADNVPVACVIPVELHSKTQLLYRTDHISIIPRTTNSHITKMVVSLDAGDPHEVALKADGTAELSVGAAPPADVILFSTKLRYLTVDVWDNLGGCGSTTGRFQLRSTDPVAIVVGINQMGGQFKPLVYAQADALEITQHLVEGLKVPASNIWLLTDDTDRAARELVSLIGSVKTQQIRIRHIVDSTTITNVFKESAAGLEPGTKVYFYFAGHQYVATSPAPLGWYYFVLPNTQPVDDDVGNMYAWRALAFDLAQLKRKQLVIIAVIDSCFSGSSVSAGSTQNTATRSPESFEGARQIGNPDTTKDRELLPVDALLTAAHESQSSWEFSDLQHGVFTYYMLDAARWAKSHSMDVTFDFAFYEYKRDGSGPTGVSGLTQGYHPKPIKNPDGKEVPVPYDQLPDAEIGSAARRALWANYATTSISH
jgi:uncharacterized caspase-like protein